MDYDETLQALADCFESEANARWAAGDILAANETNIRALASGIGKSQSYLYQLKKVSKTFPDETRARDQSWSLHSICASADEPETWLERSLIEGWSTRELRKNMIDAGEIKANTKRQKLCANCGYILQ